MFCDLLFCSDCKHKLWHHVNPRNKDIKFFSCSNYKKDTRGTCDARHYVREDAVYQVVTLELQRLARLLKYDEEYFADILAKKTNADLIAEKKCVENSLRSAMARYEEVGRLYDVAYEKNVNGLIDDDWFMHLSDKYGKERLELKEKIKKYRERLENLETEKQGKDLFVSAVKKFMQMQTLTAPLIKELIDKIVVYEAEGTGKNKTQKLIIYYRFVGLLEFETNDESENYKADIRQGVEIEYLTA